VRRVLWTRIIQRHILNCVGRADDLGIAFLTARRPHGEPRKEDTVAELQLAEGIRDIAAGIALRVSTLIHPNTGPGRNIRCVFLESSHNRVVHGIWHSGDSAFD